MTKSILRLDWGLLAPALVLSVFGLSGILSLDFNLFKSQFVFLIISLFCFLVFSQINYRSIKVFMMPIYAVSIIFLSVLLIIGVENRGSVRWIDFFGFGIQFSELLKPFLAISLSAFLVSRKEYAVKDFILILGLFVPIFILIFMQPDLGNALIYLITGFLVIFSFGFPIRYFISVAVVSLISFPVFWSFLKTYQKQRVLTFIQPGIDPLGTSYNAIQSVIAVGSGMIFGKGYGQGTQSILRFLPERHTDFIFATLSEELGFVGSLLIIITFCFLFYKIFIITKRTQDSFVRIFSITGFFLLLVQFFVNAGMNIGVMPIVGVTLPFVSYGGSSLLSSFILLGILSSMSKDLKRKEALEIR